MMIRESGEEIAEFMFQDAPNPPQGCDGIFPLPLNPFESFMLWNDSQEYPMVFEVDLEFIGRVDRSAFEAALRDTVRRQPMLRCRVEGIPFRNAAWFYCADWQPEIAWCQEISYEQLRPAPGRLRTTPFLRLWGTDLEDQFRLVMQFHHATVDGLAALQIIGELLTTYHCLLNREGSNGLSRLDWHQLANRHHVKSCQPAKNGKRPSILATSREAWKLLSYRPKPLSSPADTDGALPLRYGEYLTFELSDSDVQSYRTAARERHSSLNDLFLSDLFQTLEYWCQRLDSSQRQNRWHRITVPVSYRSRAPRFLPGCNQIQFAFLTRHSCQICEPTNLLAGICQETLQIKNDHLADQFSVGLQLASRIPGALSFIASPSRCFSTAVLSNLGELSRQLRATTPTSAGLITCGGLTLAKVQAAPPLQANTRLAVCVMRYAGKISLTIRLDERYFSRVQAEQFTALLHRLMMSQGRTGPLA